MRSAIRCMVLCVWGLVIAGGAQAAPLDHVVFVGDSITFGAHGDPVDHSLNRFSAYVGRRLRVNEQNLGRNGGTAVEFAAHADFLDYQLHSSSILVIMLGSNDQRFIEAPLPDFRAAYRLIVSKALRVICITPTPRFDDAQINSNGDTLDDFRQVVREECTGPVIEGPSLYPPPPALWKFLVQLVHLNGRGSRVMGRAIVEVLQDQYGIRRR